jgi:hypothetical protein
MSWEGQEVRCFLKIFGRLQLGLLQEVEGMAHVIYTNQKR